MSSPGHFPSVSVVRVASRVQGPAMFVERRTLAVLEAEYRPVLSNARLLAVPRPVGMNASVEVLAHRLHLPLDPVAMPELHPVPGRGGLEALWAIDSPSGLRLPSYVVDELNFQRAWGIGLLSTPRSLGCVYPRQELTQVAWMVMAMAPVDHVVGLMCGLAATLDEIRGDPAFSVPLALMAAPGEYTGRLVATARRGEPWLYGRCLRWIARERAVAGNACPWNGPPAWPLFAAFFPSLVVGGHPTDADLVRAAWFLHESFDGGGLPDGADKHQAAATATALTYRLPRPGGWLSRLAHWSSVWQVEDGHPVAGEQGWNGMAPSVLRGKASKALGIEVSEWFGAMATIAVQLMLAYHQGLVAANTRHGADKIPLRSR